ncbi:MAG TPA: sigma-70 family RNA polymerase sigma factor [Verrucomicrobiae bacterium]|jgi:RNA polymerase sigma-70 factor (ECF subfamily)
MKPNADEIIPTRKSLLGRIKNWEDHESWREFFGLYRKLIFSYAIKSGLSEQESEDVVQETILSVAKTIKEFQYDPKRCSFKSWLRHLTQKRIADCFRKRSRETLVENAGTARDGRTPVLERVPDTKAAGLDAVWEAEWQKELLEAAVAHVKTQVSAEQFQMFDFYVLKKMPVTRAAAALGTNAAQIYLAKHRISKLLNREIRRLEEKMG